MGIISTVLQPYQQMKDPPRGLGELWDMLSLTIYCSVNLVLCEA